MTCMQAHLLGVGTLAGAGRHGGSLDDLDAWEAHTVARSHLLVQLGHSTVQSHITVLLVHVVVASPGLVAHPDAKVLDSGGPLLEDLQAHQPPLLAVALADCTADRMQLAI